MNQQQLQPGQAPAPRTLGEWLWDTTPRLAPGITTTTVLALARIWNAEGANHSIGDAALMGALSLGAAAAGWISAKHLNGDSLITATAWTASGACAIVGVLGYTSSLALAALMWVLVTGGIYALAARNWREDKRAALAGQRRYELRHMERRHDLAIAETRAQADIRVAEENVNYANALADAIAARQLLDPTTAADAAEIIKNSTPRPTHLRRVS